MRELLITARRAAVLHARDRAGTQPRTCTYEEFGRPTGDPEMPQVERTRTPWDKLEPGRGVFGSRQTRSFLASTRGVRIPGFLGDAANQRMARVAEIGRWVAYWAFVVLFGSNRLAMTPLCRTTRHSAIERERACGTFYCGLVGTSFASAAR